MSHDDPKTPLTAIITYIELLREPDITEEKKTEYLDILQRKSNRLKVLIEDLFGKSARPAEIRNPADCGRGYLQPATARGLSGTG